MDKYFNNILKKAAERLGLIKSQIFQRKQKDTHKSHTEKAKNSIRSREKYAKQVATIIRKYHGTDNDSFIFGLSGKWGAGKTTFLGLLKPELEKNIDSKTYTVLLVSPWKFGSDPTTFMRSFLSQLSKESLKQSIKGKSWLEKKLLHIRNQNLLENLQRDVSSPYFRFNKIVGSIILLITLWIVYKTLVITGLMPWEWIAYLNTNRQLLVLKASIKALFAVIALPVFISQLKFNTTNRQIVTLDGFDQIYKSILKNFVKKDLVIFVDDLDRVSAEVARNVLDTLRTFFDKKNVSFIVTGDHTVLESHIGSQVTPKAEVPDREEGRRYLKKMFNVYWPLPIPIKHEFEQFLNDEIRKKEEELNEIFTVDGDLIACNKDLLKSWLLKYFDKNFRNVIRFLETVVFNFGLVNTQLETADDELRVQLQDVKDNPMLFIRMLMIQELSAPLYERYLESPSLMTAIEEDLAENTNKLLDITIADLRKTTSLSLQQEIFLKNFMYEEPRFYQENIGIVVHSIEPFIYLASSSDFSDVRGPTTTDFMHYVSNGNISNIVTALENSGEKKLSDFADKVLELLVSLKSGDINDFLKTVHILLDSLNQVKPESFAHQHFLDLFTKVDITRELDHSISANERVKLISAFSKWLDLQPVDTDFTHYLIKFQMNRQDQSDQISPYLEMMEIFGHFSAQLFINWLTFLYTFDKSSALTATLNSLPKISKEFLANLTAVKTDIATIGATAPDTANGEIAWEIIKTINNEEINSLFVQTILDNIKAGRANITNWVASKLPAVSEMAKLDDIENAVIDMVKPYFNDFANFLSCVTNNAALLSNFKKRIWQELYKLPDLEFIPIIQLIVSQGSLASITPEKDDAYLIADRIIRYSSTMTDENAEGDIIKLLKRSQLWVSLDELPYRSKLTPKARENVKKDKVKQGVLEVFQTWQQ